jgi:preprotein translocase subunit Sss1
MQPLGLFGSVLNDFEECINSAMISIVKLICKQLRKPDVEEFGTIIEVLAVLSVF